MPTNAHLPYNRGRKQSLSPLQSRHNLTRSAPDLEWLAEEGYRAVLSDGAQFWQYKILAASSEKLVLSIQRNSKPHPFQETIVE